MEVLTETMRKFISENAGKLTITQLSQQCGAPWLAVWQFCRAEGIRYSVERREWTDKELSLLESYTRSFPAPWNLLSELLRRPPLGIQSKASKVGLTPQVRRTPYEKEFGVFCYQLTKALPESDLVFAEKQLQRGSKPYIVACVGDGGYAVFTKLPELGVPTGKEPPQDTWVRYYDGERVVVYRQ